MRNDFHDSEVDRGERPRSGSRVASVLGAALIIALVVVSGLHNRPEADATNQDGLDGLFGSGLPAGATAEEPTLAMLQENKLACVYTADGAEIALFGYIGDDAGKISDIEPMSSSGHYRPDSMFALLADVELPSDGVYAGPNRQGRLVSCDGVVYLLEGKKLPSGYPVLMYQTYGVSGTVMLKGGDIVDIVIATVTRLDLTTGKIKVVE